MSDCEATCGHCDACEDLAFRLDRDRREEERAAREERLAHPSQHPLIWI